MSLQFSVDEVIQPLVSLSYLSSDNEMKVDCPLTETEEDQTEDSDIEVIACYREAPVSNPQRVGGRGMTLDLSSCTNDRSHVNTICSQGSFFESEPNRSATTHYRARRLKPTPNSKLQQDRTGVRFTTISTTS